MARIPREAQILARLQARRAQMALDREPAKELDVPDFEKLAITIRGSQPAIRREILIPENATFEDLHLVLQVALGWRDAHLHQFEAGFVIGPDALNDGPVSVGRCLDERLTCLRDLPDSQPLSYKYDMGAEWDVAIKRIGKVPADGREVLPYILSGERAGPAEDSGNIEDWNSMAGRLRAGKGTASDRDLLARGGYEPDHDVDAFDLEEARARLERVEFDIAPTWTEHGRRRASVKVEAPFLRDRSNAIQDSFAEPGTRLGR